MGTQEQEEVRTLFVSGLPNDTKPREVYLLFRTFEGYQGSFLKLISSRPGKPPQPIAFVSFNTRKQAEFALKEIHGIRFDPANPQTLRLEFARSNSRLQPNQPIQGTTPPPPSSSSSSSASVPPPNTVTNHQQPSLSYSLQPNVNGVYGVYVMPNVALTQFGQQQDIPPPSNPRLYDIWSDSLRIPVPFQGASRLSTPSPTFELSPASAHLSVLNLLSDSESSSYSMHPQIYYEVMTPSSPPSTMSTGPNVDVPSGGNVPASTLVVSNLELHHTERVKTLFSSCEGFLGISFLSSGDHPIAFVEFKDTASAKQAMEKLQGHVLMPSSKSTGIKIEQWTREVESSKSASPPPMPSDSKSSVISSNSLNPIHLSYGSLKSAPLQTNVSHSHSAQNGIVQPSTVNVMTHNGAPAPNGVYAYNAAPFSFMYPGGYKPPQIFVNNFPSSTCMSTNL